MLTNALSKICRTTKVQHAEKGNIIGQWFPSYLSWSHLWFLPLPWKVPLQSIQPCSRNAPANCIFLVPVKLLIYFPLQLPTRMKFFHVFFLYLKSCCNMHSRLICETFFSPDSHTPTSHRLSIWTLVMLSDLLVSTPQQLYKPEWEEKAGGKNSSKISITENFPKVMPNPNLSTHNLREHHAG